VWQRDIIADKIDRQYNIKWFCVNSIEIGGGLTLAGTCLATTPAETFGQLLGFYKA
jgi:hypothetical protein